ncbi:MAG: phosphoglycerate mutase family protein [Daejeonella sp.]|uniref:SixA phosphatase family protein n=1 Tax=Daejeonella sp. TaxID=2805397 RepID=UPI002734BB7C|nr:phosphoglycerate mutase family protein [Daejeonella sp.]MDP3467144.1 phosphoglycerate mutase family protein [Daejeonella sp.]
MKKFKIGLIVFLAIVAAGCSTDAPGITTIFIVRHAEKDVSDPKNEDPELSVEGRERAEALAGKLNEIKLDAAFATKYKRTTQTAYYAAKNSNIQIQTYDGHDFTGIAELVKSKHSGQRVLIVGHSNTVLELLESFGASRPLTALTDEDYDFFFELKIDPHGKAKLISQQYGKAHHSSTIK